ncbi:MAG: hypothetical protein ACYS7M_10405, partial [Planctomycetota bacterium]
MSTCISKVIKTQVACYKKTGAACLESDSKVTKALSKASAKIAKKCPNQSEVDAAGYGPYAFDQLGPHFEDSCEAHASAALRRTFGADGSTFTGADEAGQKCLLTAGKETGKQLSKALKVLSKCPGGSCTTEGIATAIAEIATKASTKLDKKCTDLAGLLGLDSEAFAAAATAQVPSSVASPCDSMDETRCVFPFPSDYFSMPDTSTDSGRRLLLGAHALPQNIGSESIDTAPWNAADGFSIGPMLLINNVNLDLEMTGAAPITDLAESLDPNTPILLLDAETGEQLLLWVERDQRGADASDQAIIGRVGRNLQNGRRYIVAMRGLKDSGGGTLAASPAFAAYRDATATDLLPVEARRGHMEEIFATLEGFGIPRNDLYLAWDFTTQSADSTAGRLLAIRDDAFDILGATAPSFTVDTIDEPFDPNNIFRRVDGTFQVPLYLEDGGVPGSVLRVDDQGVPFNEGDFFTANYRCIIPYAATTGGGAPAVPARAALYGHGLLGTESQTSSSHVRDFSSEHNFVICGTAWTGFAEEDAETTVLAVLANFTNFPRFIDRQHQGILNFMVLGRLLLHADGFASNSAFQVGGESVIDPNDLFYDGNSQGGIIGGVLAAVAQDIERFVLGVPGINYSTLLNRSIFPELPERDGPHAAVRRRADPLGSNRSERAHQPRDVGPVSGHACEEAAVPRRVQRPPGRTGHRRDRRAQHRRPPSHAGAARNEGRSRGHALLRHPGHSGVPVRRIGPGDLGQWQSGAADGQRAAGRDHAGGPGVGRSDGLPEGLQWRSTRVPPSSARGASAEVGVSEEQRHGRRRVR